MRKADSFCALSLVGLALVVIVEGRRLGMGWGTDGPRAGFFPFWLGVGLAASGVIILLQTGILRRAAPSGTVFIEPGAIAPVLTVLAPAVGMVAVIHVLGLYAAGGIYLGAYMRWIGRYSWPMVVLIAVAIPVATFLIFERWFLVPLPKGPIEALLGY
jgi:hypothetical protein